MRTLTDAEAVAKCASGPVVSESEALELSESGERVYGLLSDHSQIVSVSAYSLPRHDWAGFWRGATSIPIARA